MPAGTLTATSTVFDSPGPTGPKAAAAGCVHPLGTVSVSWPLAAVVPLFVIVTCTGTVSPARPTPPVAVAASGDGGIGLSLRNSISDSVVFPAPGRVNSMR